MTPAPTGRQRISMTSYTVYKENKLISNLAEKCKRAVLSMVEYWSIWL